MMSKSGFNQSLTKNQKLRMDIVNNSKPLSFRNTQGTQQNLSSTNSKHLSEPSMVHTQSKFPPSGRQHHQ